MTCDNRADRCDGEARENSVIGNVVELRSGDDRSARSRDRARHIGLTQCRCFSVRPKHDLHLQWNLLVIRLAENLLAQNGGIQRLHTILRSPWSEIAKTGENVTPRSMAVGQIPSGDPGLPKALDLPQCAHVRNKQVRYRRSILIARQLLLIDQFEARDSADGLGESRDAPPDLKDEQSLGGQRRWICS